MEYFFGDEGGYPVALLPYHPEGDPVVADGKYVRNLQQANSFYGTPIPLLERIWNRAMRQLAPAVQTVIAGDMMIDQHDHALKRQYGHLSAEVFELFVARCRASGISPWSSDLYPREDGAGKRTLVIEVGVRHYRRVAQADPRYVGPVGPYFRDAAGAWHSVWTSDRIPVAARMGVRLKNEPKTLWSKVTWINYLNTGFSEALSKKQSPSFRLGIHAERMILDRVFGDGFSKVAPPRELAEAV